VQVNQEQAKKLREPFPKSAIGKLPKAGLQLDFVGHAAVTQRLLEVDAEWTWEPMGYDASGLPAFDEHGGLWIRLTACGVTRCGYGEPMGGDVFDRRKGAIGNAIRNAAMRFGVALDLWSKDDIHTTFEEPKPVASDKQLATWTKQILAADTMDALISVGQNIGAYAMGEDTRAELVATWTARKGELA
jgi:hypothetical protein